jgi:hypothetical protein
LCVVPIELSKQNPNLDLATLFFYAVFGSENAKRGMQGVIALSIFGNSEIVVRFIFASILIYSIVVVMTYTASRVKQEIAKEGILPGALFFATGKTTPIGWFTSKFLKKDRGEALIEGGNNNARDPLEQSPMAALALHWASSLLLIAVTSSLNTDTAYTFLTHLYSYVIVVFVSFWVTTGLIYCKFIRKNWVAGFHPLGGSTAAIIYW